VARGAYVLAPPAGDGAPEVILLASGSEVQLATCGHERLVADGVRCVSSTCVVSGSSSAKDAAYRERVLPAACPCRLAVEAAVSFGWDRWVGDGGEIIGLDHFARRLRRRPSSSSSALPPTTSTSGPRPC